MKKTVLTTSLLMAGASMTLSSAFAGVDPLTQVKPADAGWGLNGAPDYIVEVPAALIPATGVLDYINTTIDMPFEEDKWVKSVQFIPGDKRVLHHLLSYVVPGEDSDHEFDEADNIDTVEFLEGYAPGKEDPTTYPENTGVKIPVGSALRMSIHYTAMGQETEDATRVGLWFHDDEAENLKRFRTYSVSARGGRENNIIIPPGDMHYEMASNHVFEEETTLYSFRAHMHYRGKSMRAAVIYPDQTREEIINVANYNFGWQPTYRLTEPMTLPAGSRVVVEGSFDNSQYNVGVPDPSQPALGGLQSWDEMFIGYFSYTDE